MQHKIHYYNDFKRHTICLNPVQQKVAQPRRGTQKKNVSYQSRALSEWDSQERGKVEHTSKG